MAPDFFCKFTGKTRPCAQTIYIDFGDNFNFGELVVGKLDCRRVGLSESWFVGELSSYLLKDAHNAHTGN